MVNESFTMRTDGASQAVVRAGGVLLAFDAERPALTALEVARLTALNRSTAYRMLRSLEVAGLVRRHGNVFSLAPPVLRLGDAFLAQLMGLPSAAGPVLERLRDATGETAALHIRDGMSRVVVRQVESRHELRRHYPDIGRPLPLHSGAPSRAILAFLTDSEVESYLARASALGDPLPNLDQLRDDIRAIRTMGFVVSRNQRTPGVASVAAPIFDGSGLVAGAVNVSGPGERFDEASTRRFAKLVLRASLPLSEVLGYRGHRPARVG